MANYRRYFVPGGTYFFTVVTCDRSPLFETSGARSLLNQKMKECRKKWPFEIEAFVILHDHLHMIWSLPPGDFAYPTRWGWIKKEFTKAWIAQGGAEQPVSSSRQSINDRGVWQPRYWEHTIENECEFERHLN